MLSKGIRLLFLGCSLLLNVNCLNALSLTDPSQAFNVTFNVMIRPETFVASLSTFLDEAVHYDLFWFARHTADILFNVIDANAIVEFTTVLRNKVVWGNYGSVGKTAKSNFKLIDTVTGVHDHALLRNFFHARELWMRIDMSKLFCMPTESSHYLTIGAFPFQLGRGIALGDAFAVGPETLGFYTDTAVDQFAYGLLFSGDFYKDIVSYAFYFSLIETKTDSFSNTSAEVRAQQYGRQTMPQRGFGVVNYVFAGYFDCYAINSEEWGSLRFQPYWLFNEAKEQKVEFFADSSSRLGTLGIECEYLGSKVEFGIETAMNLGRQCVRGWDRNSVVLQATDGHLAQVNSHVKDSSGATIPFIKDGDAQEAIYNVPQTAASNGQQIPGDFPLVGFFAPVDGEIFNAKNRFRDSYANTYKGWMLVSDASWLVCERDLRISATVAFASGDDNPNFDTHDGNFKGFIGLQELYSGKRVKSAFLLGGAGKVTRPIANPISAPIPVETSNVLTNTVSGFTNLIFGGLGLTWTPSAWDKPLKFNPNILVYWQDARVPKFGTELPLQFVNRFLGVEANMFTDCNIAKNLKVYCVMSVFVPGTFFKDIKGRKVTQAAFIAQMQSQNRTGLTKDTIPAYGDNTSVTFNLGLEYRF
jgi:hypothetical protein